MVALIPDFAHTEVIFPSEQHLEAVVYPYSKNTLTEFLTERYGIQVQIDSELEPNKKEPLNRNKSQNLFSSILYQNDYLTVFYPENPRSSHQLSLVMNRKINGIQELNEEEALELHAVIKKINEIYVNQLSIDGYVLAQYETPQERHENQCVIEILPHQEGQGHCRNFLDKADSNRHVLFGDRNLSAIDPKLSKIECEDQINFWKHELQIPQTPLSSRNLSIQLPAQALDSHFNEGQLFALNHLLELFENSGAHVSNKPMPNLTLASDSATELKTRTVASCAFCREKVINRQKVFEYNDIYILYNFRKMPYPATSFLILPKRHTEKLYSLTQEEVKTIALLRKALFSVLKEKYPNFQLISYCQDAPSVGQTVPHTHEQIVSLDPQTIPLTWSLMSLAYNPQNVSSGVSDEEMLEVTSSIGTLLRLKIEELTQENNDFNQDLSHEIETRKRECISL